MSATEATVTIPISGTDLLRLQDLLSQLSYTIFEVTDGHQQAVAARRNPLPDGVVDELAARRRRKQATA